MCCHGILSLGLTILDGWEKGGGGVSTDRLCHRATLVCISPRWPHLHVHSSSYLREMLFCDNVNLTAILPAYPEVLLCNLLLLSM